MMDALQLVVSFCTGCIAFAVCAFLWVHGKSRWMKRSHASYVEKVQYFAFELVRARLDTALCELRLAEEIGKMPEQFEAAVFVAARVGYAVERAVMMKAEQLGLVGKSDLAKEAVAEIKQHVEPKSEAQPILPLEAPLSMEWRDGRLVPRQRPN